MKILMLMASFVLPTMRVQPQAQPADVVDDPEAYAVYATIRPASSRITILRQETVSKPQCLPSGEAFMQDWRPGWTAFNKENARVRTLLPQ